MNLISADAEGELMISTNLEELHILHAALNEICHGIEIFEFETRIGASLEEVKGVMRSLDEILDS
ncbi:MULTISPECIES: hypothetical protein [Rhizobium]|uniref:Uncharacterized protein n=1 Tax=Rhizobium leguminosarum bv. viciae TaxID=387 RepID=A0A8G2IY99_RHILV|nr:hypothetical protein [Rhizobium leguminosarum]NKK08553.1 hypothetical protein [Rhizobium leguminosarum bv. viciae]NKK22301.1 hypothetical protein [Rhizobium leguminosarum bv. viciae]TBF67965.1 hypothetical protein ELG89_26420 [Rhizobium leguminosarum]TBG52315.1 hypothetical protein ELG71_30345 [Rhizobium leguminosarum]TBG55423.1 hypothetical protein ELG74_29095 [Rhizobium leguminosarum]